MLSRRNKPEKRVWIFQLRAKSFLFSFRTSRGPDFAHANKEDTLIIYNDICLASNIFLIKILRTKFNTQAIFNYLVNVSMFGKLEVVCFRIYNFNLLQFWSIFEKGLFFIHYIWVAVRQSFDWSFFAKDSRKSKIFQEFGGFLRLSDLSLWNVVYRFTLCLKNQQKTTQFIQIYNFSCVEKICRLVFSADSFWESSIFNIFRRSSITCNGSASDKTRGLQWHRRGTQNFALLTFGCWEKFLIDLFYKVNLKIELSLV